VRGRGELGGQVAEDAEHLGAGSPAELILVHGQKVGPTSATRNSSLFETSLTVRSVRSWLAQTSQPPCPRRANRAGGRVLDPRADHHVARQEVGPVDACCLTSLPK
jgi:hypothetical protein